MSVQNVKAGRAYVEIAADETKFGRSLRSVTNQLGSFRSAVLGIGGQLGAVFSGAALGGGVLAAAKSFAHAGSELADMSARTGIAAETLSEYALAAKLADTSLGGLAIGLKKMQVFLVEAVKGSKENIGTISDLGISIRELARSSTVDQFEMFADKIAELKDPAVKVAYAVKIFGKSATELLPLLENGADGLRNLRREARELGVTMSNEDAESADEFGDSLDALKMAIGGVFNRIGSALAPMLNQLAQGFSEVVATVSDWLNRNRALVALLSPAIAIFGTLGATLATLGVAFWVLAHTVAPVVVSVFAAIAAGVAASVVPVAALGAALGGLTIALSSMGATWSDVGSAIATGWVQSMAFVANSLGPIGTAIAGFVSQLVEGFRWMYAGATQYFGAIGQALASGNLEAAANVAFAGIKRAFRGGFNVLYGYYLDFTTAFQSGWDQWTYDLAGAFTDGISYMFDIWNSFTTGLMMTWNTSIGFIQKAWIRFKSLFDESINADAETQAIDQRTNDANAASIGSLASSFEKSKADRIAQQKILDQDRKQKQIQRQNLSDQLRDQANAEFDQAKKSYDDALAAVQSDFNPDMGKGTKLKFDPNELNLDNLLSKTLQEKDKISSKGSFSAFAAVAGGLQSDAVEKTEKNTAQANQLLKAILNKPGAVFT